MSTFTNLERSKKYLEELHEWISDTDRWLAGEPDSRDFPQNQKGDIVLLLDASRLYVPHARSWDNVVEKTYYDHQELNGLIVELQGYSGINYYNPWEEDLEIKCPDGEVRYLNAQHPCHKEDTFIFVPHPEVLEKFKAFLSYLAEDISNVEQSLDRLFTEFYAN
jgi:hypothetical protein